MEETVIEVPTPPALPKEETPVPQKPAKKRRKWLIPVIIGGGVAFLLAIAGILFFFLHTSDLPFKPDTSLIPVYDGEHWGYINKKGNYVINPQFKDAEWFNEGLALVKAEDGKYGFIDKKGNYEIPAQYSQATIFNEGLAFVVEEGGYPTCIDKDGDIVFEFSMAEGVGCFQEGLAPFYVLNDKNEAKWGFVDKKGNVAINPQFSVAYSFSNGLAAVANDKEKYGFIDKDGLYVINPQFDYVGNFRENGMAAFKSGDKWGYIDKKGKYVINPQFDDSRAFFDEKALVCQNNKYGFINQKGNFIINPQFEGASFFLYGEGVAAVLMDGKVGFIDEKGKYVINPQFEYASDFIDGMSFVRSGEKYGIINKKGNYIVNPQFENIRPPYLDFSMVQSEYYDASKFLSTFLMNFHSSQVDGIPAVGAVTLSDIATSSKYGDLWQSHAWGSRITLRPDEEMSDDITLTDVEFNFLSDTYTYSYDWWSYEKDYNYSAVCSYVAYSFDLDNKAESRSGSIAAALCNKLKSIYDGTVSNFETEYTYGTNKTVECNNVNFIVMGSYSKLYLMVFFDKDSYDKALRELTKEEEIVETEVTEASDDWDSNDSCVRVAEAADEW